jgi:hypothetical protein
VDKFIGKSIILAAHLEEVLILQPALPRQVLQLWARLRRLRATKLSRVEAAGALRRDTLLPAHRRQAVAK